MQEIVVCQVVLSPHIILNQHTFKYEESCNSFNPFLLFYLKPNKCVSYTIKKTLTAGSSVFKHFLCMKFISPLQAFIWNTEVNSWSVFCAALPVPHQLNYLNQPIKQCHGSTSKNLMKNRTARLLPNPQTVTEEVAHCTRT